MTPLLDLTIQGVIVDLGGVLVHPPTEEALARLRAAAGIKADGFADAWERHRRPYDLDQINAAEYWRLVGGRSYEGAELERLLVEDAACWAVPNEDMVDWLEAIKAAGLQLALLSNMPRMQWARLKGRFAWLQLCDVVMLSYLLCLRKPDPAIYHACLNRLGLSPADVLFVDDRPENVDIAQELGLEAVLFTNVKTLRAELRSRFADQLPLP